MAPSLPKPEWATLGDTLEIPRIINGLWQLADNQPTEAETSAAAEAMNPLITAGLDTFDMADHYGPAELIAGSHARAFPSHPIKVLTKWCPADPRANTIAGATAAVDLALSRTGLSQLPLLQYHIWDYTNPSYLANLCHLRTLQGEEGKIAHLGLTNTDAAHLELLLHSGFKIVSNQVSVSVLDRRLTRGRMAGVCRVHGVGILAYGVLLGGFLSEKWVGAAEPRDAGRLGGASLRKYLRFIRAAGGWGPFQGLLRALQAVAVKHGVGIAAVAIRWVLDVDVVKAVIVGCRLDSGGSSARQAAANMAAFGLRLDADDRREIARAQEGLRDIHGDCGDEYRRPPYLTAAGDLSDHVRPDPESALRLERAVAAGKRIEFRSGSKWEPIAGYCRALRIGNVIRVSGTTANPPPGLEDSLPVVGAKCARCQAVAILDTIAFALKKLGGALSDVVRTRVIIRNEQDCEAVSHVHGRVFWTEGVRPANTLITAGLIGDEMLVEIEAEAIIVGNGNSVVIIE